MTPFVFALEDNSGLPRLLPDPRLTERERRSLERELLSHYARLVGMDGQRVRFRTALEFSRERVRFQVEVVPGQSVRCPTVRLHSVPFTPQEVEEHAATILHTAPIQTRRRARNRVA